jgi:hypothetical protein
VSPSIIQIGGKTAEAKPMGGGLVETPAPRSRRRNTLKRHEPQESNGPVRRLISARQVTNSGTVTDPEDGRPTNGLTRCGSTRNRRGRGPLRQYGPRRERPEVDQSTSRGMRASKGATAVPRGKSSVGENPMSASGLKDSRPVRQGESRQEGVKP